MVVVNLNIDHHRLLVDAEGKVTTSNGQLAVYNLLEDTITYVPDEERTRNFLAQRESVMFISQSKDKTKKATGSRSSTSSPTETKEVICITEATLINPSTNNEIWMKNSGKPSTGDYEARDLLINLVKKYRRELADKHARKKDIWQRIGEEIEEAGFSFGGRDPATVCNQKWRNLKEIGKIPLPEIYDSDSETKDGVSIKSETSLANTPKSPNSKNEIWIKHSGKPTGVDFEAQELLVKLVNEAKDSLKVESAQERRKVWASIADELVKAGFSFGKRNPSFVCRQKWRNMGNRLAKKRRLHEADSSKDLTSISESGLLKVDFSDEKEPKEAGFSEVLDFFKEESAKREKQHNELMDFLKLKMEEDNKRKDKLLDLLTSLVEKN